MTEKEIRDLFKSRGVELAKTDVWQVQQALVIKHAALERLAAEMGVRWQPPTIIRANADEAVILATGILTDSNGKVIAEEWSIGEAHIGVNYRVSGKQAAYVWAMSEKRAKDRVILKLAKLHGAYSEDEADDFKSPAPAPARAEQVGRPITQREMAMAAGAPEDVVRASSNNDEASPRQEPQQDAFGLPPIEEPTESQKLLYAALGMGIEKASTMMELELFMQDHIKPEINALTEQQANTIRGLYSDRRNSLRGKRAA